MKAMARAGASMKGLWRGPAPGSLRRPPKKNTEPAETEAQQAPQQEQEHEDDLDRYYSASDSSSETGDGAEDLTEGELQQLAAMQLQRDDEAEKERETIAAVVPGAVKYPPQSEEDVLRNLEGHWKEVFAESELENMDQYLKDFGWSYFGRTMVLQSPEIVWEGKWLVEENLFSLYASPFQMAGGDQVMKLTGAPLEVQLPLCGKPTDFLDWPAVLVTGSLKVDVANNSVVVTKYLNPDAIPINGYSGRTKAKVEKATKALKHHSTGTWEFAADPDGQWMTLTMHNEFTHKTKAKTHTANNVFRLKKVPGIAHVWSHQDPAAP